LRDKITKTMKPDDFLKALREERCSAVLRTNNQEAAKNAMDAAVAGGFRIIEFTLTIPGAIALIRSFSQRSGLIVGAGSVLTAENARDAVSSGAKFLVSPVTDAAVIAQAQELGVAMTPGAFTATEMLQAHRLGAPLQKLFPEPPGGPKYLRALLGPMPFLRVVPSHSGVDSTNALAYLEAGAYAVAFVAPLFDPEDIQQGRFDRIEERARSFKKLIHS
jgi:2-dehydro-3-deoxyphosphogluconate aldolase/(4S)-4-hydroxy-2-oxoglutarate aldolase